MRRFDAVEWVRPGLKAVDEKTFEGYAQLVKNAAGPGVTTPESSGSVRTCIGCRQTGARMQLVRLVRSTNGAGEPEALVDLRRRMPGRGAWLHPNSDCLQLAVKRRAIPRALPGVSNVHDVAAQFANISGDGK